MQDDNRIIRRQRVLKGGKIVFPNDGPTLECVIRNLSVAGALIEISSMVGVPHTFTLIDMKTGISHDATLAWRKGTRIGVSFSDRPDEDEENA